jgi:hypothetical protein
MTQASFKSLEASLLHCPKCRKAVPVRKKLLIILPEGNKFEYLCTQCASALATKIEPDEPLLDRGK